MSEGVKRRYDASGRQEQARRTQRAVITAAAELWLERGYGGATIADVARHAGVSPETVYGAFGSKGGLLHRVWDITIGGDDEEVVFHERPEVMAMRAEPDLRKRLALHARFHTKTAARIVPFMLMVQAASGHEPTAKEMLAEIGRQRFEGMGVMAREAEATGQLGVSEQECREVMWTTTDGQLWHLLVQQRGWDDERFADWLARLWVSALKVRPPASRRSPAV